MENEKNKNSEFDPDFEANPEFEVDPEYIEWICQRVRDEAAGNAKETDNEPDLGKFEPTDEIFERIVKEARERGLLKED